MVEFRFFSKYGVKWKFVKVKTYRQGKCLPFLAGRGMIMPLKNLLHKFGAFMQNTSFKRTKLACYSSYFTMSSVFCVPALLVTTMYEIYGISYFLLGTLVFLNFITQLSVDLIFTVFSKKFNIRKLLQNMPLITALGLCIYALFPVLFPKIAYLGLVIGTIIFSVASGLSEVFLSPIIAAIPSENPQKEMSLLHSLYAFGVLTSITISTVFFKLFSVEKWMYLVLFFALLPIITAVLFRISPLPPMQDAAGDESHGNNKKRRMGFALCVLCIFFGACAEASMTNWVSSYMETALHIDKAIGDVVGMAGFIVLLGLTRVAYAKFGKNIIKTLLVGMIGASICYVVAGFSTNVVFSLTACILTGIFTAMLWPGTLIMMEENISAPGVAAYALMASGGDMGCALAPQIFGVVVDGVSKSAWGEELAISLGLEAEQLGFKAGMLFSAIFPLIGIVVVLILIRYFKKAKGDNAKI